MLEMCKILSQNKVKKYIILTGGEEMNLYYELLQFPVFSMREVNTLYSSERTARTALGKLVKEGMVLGSQQGRFSLTPFPVSDVTSVIN